jgi:hypothetical protein
LRVFVSSALEELAAERAAVREFITRQRLTPVMFELAARAHPPRELYRAYLAGSDVVVGIYGEHYGWIAPDMGTPTRRPASRAGSVMGHLPGARPGCPGTSTGEPCATGR